MLQALLESAGLTPDDVELVQYPGLRPGHGAPAGRRRRRHRLRQQRADPARAWPAIEAERPAVRRVVPLPGPGLVDRRRRRSTAKRDALAAFTAATLRAMDEIAADPQKGLDATFAAVPDLGPGPGDSSGRSSARRSRPGRTTGRTRQSGRSIGTAGRVARLHDRARPRAEPGHGRPARLGRAAPDPLAPGTGARVAAARAFGALPFRHGRLERRPTGARGDRTVGRGAGARLAREPLAQWQSRGLLILRSRVRIPDGSPPPGGFAWPVFEGCRRARCRHRPSLARWLRAAQAPAPEPEPAAHGRDHCYGTLGRRARAASLPLSGSRLRRVGSPVQEDEPPPRRVLARTHDWRRCRVRGLAYDAGRPWAAILPTRGDARGEA